MKKLNITDLLQALAKFENGYADFREFLEFHGNRAHPYVKFWRFFERNDHVYTDNRTDREQVFKVVFGKIKYDPGRMRNLLKQLVDLLDKFILFKKIETSALGQLLRAEIYRDNGAITDMLEVLERVLLLSEAYSGAKKSEIISTVNNTCFFFGEGNDPKLDDTYLEEWEQGLDEAYFINKLKVTIEKFTRLRIRGQRLEQPSRKRAERMFALLPEEKSPLIAVLALSARYFFKPSKERYEAFKMAYSANIDLLAPEKKYLFVSLINSLAVFSKIKGEMRKEYLVLYSWALENNIFEEGLSSVQFDNIVFAAESFADYDLIEKVTLSHGKLIKDERERSLLLAESYASFGKRDYKKVLATLEKLEAEHTLNFNYNIKKYLLRFKCIYEMEQDKQSAFILINEMGDSFRKLLGRHLGKEINIDVKTRLLNFFNFIKKIADRNSSKNSKTALFAKLNSLESKISELNWIKEKLAELD